MKVQKPRSSPVTCEHLNPHALQMGISGALNFWGATRTRVLQASDKSGFQVRRPIKHDHQFEVNSGSDHQYQLVPLCNTQREKNTQKVRLHVLDERPGFHEGNPSATAYENDEHATE